MLEAVDFISLDTFRNLQPEGTPLAALSLGSPAEMPPSNLRLFRDALRLEFVDLTEATLNRYGYPPEALCQPEQMAEAIAFVKALHEKESPVRLVVHCHMGLSRSAGMALMAHALTQCAFPRYGDSYYANSHVVGLARAQLNTTIQVPPIPTPEDNHENLPPRLAI